MNTTMEKSEMMENEMEMGMEAQMPEMMKANLAGEQEQPEEEMNPVNAIIGVVKNKINDLAEELDMADIEYGKLPVATWEGILNAIRAKAGISAPLTAGEVQAVIESIVSMNDVTVIDGRTTTNE